MEFEDEEEDEEKQEEEEDDLLNSMENEEINDYKDAEEFDSKNLMIRNKLRRGEKQFFKLENP